jgi:signal transduction histidine kinase
MQIKESLNVSVHGALESPALQDVVVLADSAGVALGVPRAYNPRIQSIPHEVSGLIASRWVEIPLVGGNGEISGVLYQTAPRFNASGALCAHRLEGAGVNGDVAQFVVHDINNLFAVISSGLRLLECRDDAAYRKVIIGKMQEAITRGASLSRELLDMARPRPNTIDGFFEGNRFAAMAATFDQALRPDIAVRTEIAPDLWDFNADPEELYFALLNLCRNSADAMPNGGAITVAARNVEISGGAVRGVVEIVVADDGEGMTEEVLSQALNPYFTTKAPGSGSGLGLPQVQRFAEGRGGAFGIESKLGAGTRVRLFLPRVNAAEPPSHIIDGEISYRPTPEGGVFHVVNSATAAST